MLTTMRPMETTNCQTGGISDAIRRNMMIGAVGGKSEARIDQMEFESLMMRMMRAKLSQVGAAARGMYICSSCSVSQVAARPAKSEL